MSKHILVVASTFPASDSDPVPAFVRDQIIAMKAADPDLRFSVLAPHDKRSGTRNFSRHAAYDEYRFHYFFPFQLEKLAGRGIMPALKSNPLNYLLIPFLFLGEFFALLSLTSRLRPDVIYAHWFTPQAINARWVSLIAGVPFVFTTHAADVDVWHKIPVIGGWIVRSNARRARALTAVSQRSMAKLERFFSAKDWARLQPRTAIIPMGVNLPDTTKNPTKLSAVKTILFVGRLAEKKGVHYLLDAYAEAMIPSSRLVIAGDGSWLARLRSQAQALQLGKRVAFPGYVSGQAKQDLIESADIYVVPSIIAADGDAEGLPVSLMEGLAAGKICIATNESGADGILTDKVDGFLVPQKDAVALQQALEAAASLSLANSRRMAAAAQQTARQFAWPDIAKQHIDFLFTKH